MTSPAETVTFPQPDLAALAERFDAESQPSYVSLYADFSDQRHGDALDRRADEVRAALADDDEALARFDETLAAARERMGELAAMDGTRGGVVFAGPDGYVEAFPLPEPIDTRLVFDSSPYIKPLAAFGDAHEAFALVLMDSEWASLFLVQGASAEVVEETETDLNGRHRKGGQSQRRFERHRQTEVEKFYADVLERVQSVMQKAGVERLLVAGPGQAKREFAALLPKPLEEKLIGVEDVELSDVSDGAVVRELIDVARRREAEDSAEAVRELRQELMSGELAVTGAQSVVRAARNGQVDLLVLLRDAAVRGQKCEEHQSFFAPGATCACGNEGTEVDLVNEAVEYAARSKSRVEFVEDDDAFLESVGGVGALLRW